VQSCRPLLYLSNRCQCPSTPAAPGPRSSWDCASRAVHVAQTVARPRRHPPASAPPKTLAYIFKSAGSHQSTQTPITKHIESIQVPRQRRTCGLLSSFQLHEVNGGLVGRRWKITFLGSEVCYSCGCSNQSLVEPRISVQRPRTPFLVFTIWRRFPDEGSPSIGAYALSLPAIQRRLLRVLTLSSSESRSQ